MSQLSAPISLGELIDKITILEIKRARISDPDKLNNIRRELDLLNTLWVDSPYAAQDIEPLKAQLKQVNEQLWEIEDEIREKERAGTFDAGFIELARSVYFRNDERAAAKRRINEALGSDLVEEKSYADYGRKA